MVLSETHPGSGWFQSLKSNAGGFSVLAFLLWLPSLGFGALPHGGLGSPASSPETRGVPTALREIGIEEKLGTQVALDSFQFRNESNQPVSLGTLFRKGKPVVLSLVYYECPGLCTFVLSGLVQTLKVFNWTPGKEFDIVSVSINPNERGELATKKKANYLEELGKEGVSEGWHFLTGDEAQIRALADAVGFKFRYVPEEKQYAHAAALFVLTPEGRLSRILYGIDYKVRDLRLALLEAASGKIGTVIDRLILFCYRYDATTRKYSVVLTRVMQVGAALTVALLGGFLGFYWSRQRRISRVERASAIPGAIQDSLSKSSITNSASNELG